MKKRILAAMLAVALLVSLLGASGVLAAKPADKGFDEFGYNYDDIPKISPITVAETIELCLRSEANIMTINLLPEGQWKHQGA